MCTEGATLQGSTNRGVQVTLSLLASTLPNSEFSSVISEVQNVVLVTFLLVILASAERVESSIWTDF